jgi:hypothetical protein
MRKKGIKSKQSPSKSIEKQNGHGIGSEDMCNHYPKCIGWNKWECWWCGMPMECIPKLIAINQKEDKQ